MKTYINNKKIGVWLPNKMYQALKREIQVYNESTCGSKLNLAKASYIMNLLYFIPLSRDEKYDDGWIPICSETLKRIYNYTDYIKFLQDEGFLDRRIKNYSTSSNECRKYKLGKKYRNHQLDFHWVEDNTHFIKKTNEFKIDRMKYAEVKCPHLTKWLTPEKLSIDFTSALKHVRETYEEDSQINKRNTRIYIIKSIENKSWSYSRDGLDNRLHSIFTSIPKDIRRFVKYNQEDLISLDIKNSQPFIYTSLLNQLINPSINRLSIFLSNKYNIVYTSIMSQVFRNTTNNNALQAFVNQVLDGTFYEQYGEILYNEGLISKDVFEQCYISLPKKIKGTWVRNQEKYENLRKASKDMVIQSLFSSEKCHSKFISVFKKHYPEIYRITQFIKANQEKNFFPVLLQNVEANSVLDYCTKIISDSYPEMPLFTIHDSIVTTAPYRDILQEEFSALLGKYFGLNPSLKTEHWQQVLYKVS
ncbi:hypothetical protein SAMN03097699_0604 [Flavobacteriaceae bacterium MAR_2010_188]|nr:hypothetical protein SAMN03097699_0604 [Flavobacteriaceae bacterium MAR_2010_188]